MRRCVVGVDGREPSLAALAWAERAIAPEGHLEIVHVGDAATSWFDTVLGTTPHPVPITTSQMSGSVAEALRRRAEQTDAGAIVVGAHRRGGMRPRRLGRTIHSLLVDPSKPVVVVPPDGHDAAGPVVVGAGHGAGTDAAVDWAATFAAEHTRALWLVRAIGTPPMPGLDALWNIVAYYLKPSQRLTWASEDLHDLTVRARRAADGLDIAAATVTAMPARALQETSHRASLVVLGLHRGEISGHDHLPRQLRHVLTHTRTPIAVIPPPHEP